MSVAFQRQRADSGLRVGIKSIEIESEAVVNTSHNFGHTRKASLEKFG
jgi:hypothetical protein